MTLNEMAYRQGIKAAAEKFAAGPMSAATAPVAPTAPTATIAPAAPNMLAAKPQQGPVLATGQAPSTTTVASQGQPGMASARLSGTKTPGTPAGERVTTAMLKVARRAVHAPIPPARLKGALPQATPRGHVATPVGSPPANVPPVTQTTPSTVAGTAGTPGTSVVNNLGKIPPVAVADNTAEYLRGRVVGDSGGGV